MYSKRGLPTVALAGFLLAVLVTPALVLGQQIHTEKPTTNSAVRSSDEALAFEQSFPALGTLIELKTFSNDANKVAAAFSEAEQLALTLDQVLSDYAPQSETRQLTTLAINEPHEVSETLFAVIQAAHEWHERSQGAFDASLGPYTRLSRKYRRAHQLPPQALRDKALEQCGWEHLRIDSSKRTIQFDTAGMILDFGAIGKGYIADKIFEHLAAHDLPVSLVNISGNMRIGKPPPQRNGWRIAIRGHDGKLEDSVLVLADCGIATSGDLSQFVEENGVRYSHLIDPRDGSYVKGPISATVIAPTAMHADAGATAISIAGIEISHSWSRDVFTAAVRSSLSPDGNPILSQTRGFTEFLRRNQ